MLKAKPAATVGSHAGGSSSRAGRTDAPAADAEKSQQSSAALSLLLRVEALAREARDIVELRHLMANETRKLNRARQTFVVEVQARGKASVEAVSNVATVDSQSFLIQSIERLVSGIATDRGLGEFVEFMLPAFTDPDNGLVSSYPFPHICWLPLLDRRGRVFAGLLMTSDNAWTGGETLVTRRLGAAYAHAWREIATARAFGPRTHSGAKIATACVALAIAALLIPVPMTALAPAEVVPGQPSVISAPIDGVIDRIEVKPSSRVAAGDVLLRLSDTTLRNRAEVAAQEVIVAEARVKQATILAFSDARGRHELGVAQAELALKQAESTFARDLLEKSVIRAPVDGVAVFADPQSLVGKPVVTGERIMDIADPARVEVRIDLAVPDAIALRPNSKVRLFLDADPLNARDGTVVRSDYRARPSDSDVLSFKTFARLDEGGTPPRLGLRGTAQVQGDQTRLGIYLFRRPLTAIRQWIGI